MQAFATFRLCAILGATETQRPLCRRESELGASVDDEQSTTGRHVSAVVSAVSHLTDTRRLQV